MEFHERLSNQLSNLPGIVAHQAFYPIRFQHFNKPENAKLSAVGVHFFRENEEIHLILIERSEYDGPHSKQIAFPGGKKELYDKNLEETARRESIEELNLTMTNSKLIGQITPVYIPVSNFEVYPFLYWHTKIPTFDLTSNEVDDVIFVRCADLMDDSNQSNVDIQISTSNQLNNIPCFKLENRIVWGATALILSEIKELLKRI
jgi:8-oxo-dGTP pyrophosphatase MutT (NUDIX family)